MQRLLRATALVCFASLARCGAAVSAGDALVLQRPATLNDVVTNLRRMAESDILLADTFPDRSFFAEYLGGEQVVVNRTDRAIEVTVTGFRRLWANLPGDAKALERADIGISRIFDPPDGAFLRIQLNTYPGDTNSVGYADLEWDLGGGLTRYSESPTIIAERRFPKPVTDVHGSRSYTRELPGPEAREISVYTNPDGSLDKLYITFSVRNKR